MRDATQEGSSRAHATARQRHESDTYDRDVRWTGEDDLVFDSGFLCGSCEASLPVGGLVCSSCGTPVAFDDDDFDGAFDEVARTGDATTAPAPGSHRPAPGSTKTAEHWVQAVRHANRPAGPVLAPAPLASLASTVPEGGPLPVRGQAPGSVARGSDDRAAAMVADFLTGISATGEPDPVVATRPASLFAARPPADTEPGAPTERAARSRGGVSLLDGLPSPMGPPLLDPPSGSLLPVAGGHPDAMARPARAPHHEPVERPIGPPRGQRNSKGVPYGARVLDDLPYDRDPNEQAAAEVAPFGAEPVPSLTEALFGEGAPAGDLFVDDRRASVDSLLSDTTPRLSHSGGDDNPSTKMIRRVFVTLGGVLAGLALAVFLLGINDRGPEFGTDEGATPAPTSTVAEAPVDPVVTTPTPKIDVAARQVSFCDAAGRFPVGNLRRVSEQMATDPEGTIDAYRSLVNNAPTEAGDPLLIIGPTTQRTYEAVHSGAATNPTALEAWILTQPAADIAPWVRGHQQLGAVFQSNCGIAPPAA